jgi:hypothetical protein
MAYWKMTDKPRKLPWRAQFKRKGYKTLVKNLADPKEAKAWSDLWDKQFRELGLPSTIENLKGTTIAQIIEKYRDEITPTKGCCASETATINTFLRHLKDKGIQDTPLPFFKKTDAYSYVATRLKEIRNGRRITPSTVNREKAILHHIWETANECWGLDTLPIPGHSKGVLELKERRRHESVVWMIDRTDFAS